MPTQCKTCELLPQQYKQWGQPYVCNLSGKIVNINRGLCKIKSYQKQILSLKPLERTNRIMVTKDESTILKELGIDPESIKPVTDFVTGTKDWDMTHRDILNLDVIILSAVETSTSYGQAYLADCIVKNERKTVLIGSKILYKQFAEIGDNFPLRGTVIKPGKYYTFASA